MLFTLLLSLIVPAGSASADMRFNFENFYKQDDEAAYILLGIENQTDIHYAMPVRNIIYDALQYGKQVADIAAKHRASDGDSKGHTTEKI